METTPVNGHKVSILKKSLLLFVYVLFLLLIGLYAFRKPAYNWDMLAYIAIVIKIDHHYDSNLIHKITYNTARENIPPGAYGYLSTGPYREKMATSSAGFYAQLPFYAVKPLYIGMIYLFYKIGFSLPISTVMPSILAYLLTGLLLLHWLKKYVTLFYASIAGLLVMYSTFMISIARISTPDSLSAFLLFAAFYFIIEKPSIMFLFIFLLLSVFARIDNIVTCFFILSFLFFTGKWQKKISFKQYLLMLSSLVVAYFFITLMTVRPFGWDLLYYPTFIHHFNLSREFHPAFSLKEYIALLYSQAITAIVVHHFALFIFLALLIAGRPSIRFYNFTLHELFPLLLVFIILIRFLLFPDLDDRFYASFYLCILVLLVRKYTNLPVIDKAPGTKK